MFVFFFKHTTTTWISAIRHTLALHYALPFYAEGLLLVLMSYLRGDRQICSVVHVPSPEEEDAKRPHRERAHLVQERVRIANRIEALLATQDRKRTRLNSSH